MWGIEPAEGTLLKDTLTNVTISVLPKVAMEIRKVDVFNVHITDAATKERVAQFPIQVSFHSFYSE